jgi:LEA14-like dessication related protein
MKHYILTKKSIGFASFGGTTEIISLKVVGGAATYIAVDLVIALNNPSQITITAGDLNFDVIMDASGSKVGVVTLANTIIKPGRNEMAASMKMTSTDLASLSRMLTNYLTNQVTPLTVKGSANSTKIIPLQPGLAQVALKTNMQGIPASLVVENQMKLVGLSPHIWVKFYNPLDTPYTVTGVNCDVFFTSKTGSYLQLGTLSGAIDPPVTVPVKGTAVNEKELVLKTNLGNAIQFLMLQADARKVDLFQNVTVTVGEAFHGGMYYEQKNVPVVDKDTSASAQALDLALKSIPGANSTNATTTLQSTTAATTATSTIIDTTTTTTTTTTATTNAEQATTIATTEAPTTTTAAATTNAPQAAATATSQPQVVVDNFVLPY